MHTEEKLYREWEKHHIDIGEPDRLTLRRAFLAGYSEGRKDADFAAAMVTRSVNLAKRMRAAIASMPPPKTPADQADLAELDKNLRDWVERPCEQWQNAESCGALAHPTRPPGYVA